MYRSLCGHMFSFLQGVQLGMELAYSRCYIQRRRWHPTPVLLPGESHRRRSLVGCSPWVANSQTRLSDFTFPFHFHALEKEMATHSSVLAWRIPGTGSLAGCRLWDHTELDMTEVTQQQQQQEISREIFKYLELNENSLSKFVDAAKAVLGGSSIALKAYIKKKSKINNLSIHLRKLEKLEQIKSR